MDFLQEFNRIMVSQKELALATSVDNIPNVRIINFYYNISRKGVIYFSTFSNNSKVEDFAKNNIVAFTTIPTNGNEHVRVNKATIKKSNLTIFDLKNEFIKKIPDYEITINEAGDQLSLYEIHFNQATVTLDYTQSDIITL
ncbi:pyridoxamine 5'-phosphate oxidase family protein [Clostridium tagluense]|uniref:pyridoxamine 5'-phosphate oxidase family protein n=1 Tax=Clostridium tagluense TaxID=360422 RepID=UPI001C6EFBE6|nr:pyridoxamine 5'-phosphate oxidase family protein [Clostridium tagluense]MBW9156160.1 pyridoxamine 5'-phosphate oxidase family protein [Clostridium tagluense]WLC65601.1 pyridoxamine 5'-phosphate oxidase family protein [Clostridium tagluense]